MPTWRCPHCSTPQPETSRCWLCGKVTTACLACRHYRRGMAGGLALCGRNPKGPILHGTEVMPCWEGPPPASASAVPTADGHLPIRGYGSGAAEEPGMRVARTFVPVEELAARAAAGDQGQMQVAQNAVRQPPDWGWTLFAEVEA